MKEEKKEEEKKRERERECIMEARESGTIDVTREEEVIIEVINDPGLENGTHKTGVVFLEL